LCDDDNVSGDELLMAPIKQTNWQTFLLFEKKHRTKVKKRLRFTCKFMEPGLLVCCFFSLNLNKNSFSFHFSFDCDYIPPLIIFLVITACIFLFAVTLAWLVRAAQNANGRI
jgi:hypothetical protein